MKKIIAYTDYIRQKQSNLYKKCKKYCTLINAKLL